MKLSEQEALDRATELYRALADSLSLDTLAVEDGRTRLVFGEDNEQAEVELEIRTSGWLYAYAPLRAPAHWDEDTLRRVLAAPLSRLAGASLAVSEETGTPLLLMALPLAQLTGESLATLLEGFAAQATVLGSTDLATVLATPQMPEGQATNPAIDSATENTTKNNESEEILRI